MPKTTSPSEVIMTILEVFDNFDASYTYNTKGFNCVNLWIITKLLGIILSMHHTICTIHNINKIIFLYLWDFHLP